MSDMTDKLAGKTKEMAGKATHNKKLEAKGRIQHDIAEIHQKAQEALDHLSEKLHHH